ncbi:MAG: hypothetical protein IJ058_01480 [Lachnospiraceae bacterium]|nr:hypothetical protein [Lachnospiraceae bacterium]
MRIGKLPTNVYARSADRIIHKYNKDRGADCPAVCAFLCSETWVLGSEPGYWKYEFESVMQGLMGRYLCLRHTNRPLVLGISLTLPINMEEPALRTLLQAICEVCGEWNLTICLPQIISSDAVSRAIITVQAGHSLAPDGTAGRDSRQPDCDTGIITETLRPDNHAGITAESYQPADTVTKPARFVLMIGHAGAAGCALLSRIHESQLYRRFSTSYIEKMQNLRDLTPARQGVLADIARTDPELFLFPVSEGGIYGALWDMCEELDSGITVQLKDIPVYQETVELCDLLDLDLYKLYSAGALLAVTGDPDGLSEKLNAAGVPASLIGCLTDTRDRVILKGDEVRFITKPDMDEIYKEPAAAQRVRG